MKAKVGPKGQIVIPKAIRERLGVRPNDVVFLDIEGERMVVEKPQDPLKVIEETAKRIGAKSSQISMGDELYEEVFGGKHGLSRRERVRVRRSGRG